MGERVPVLWSYGNKRTGEWDGSTLCNIIANHVLHAKQASGRITDFNSSDHIPWIGFI